MVFFDRVKSTRQMQPKWFIPFFNCRHCQNLEQWGMTKKKARGLARAEDSRITPARVSGSRNRKVKVALGLTIALLPFIINERAP